MNRQGTLRGLMLCALFAFSTSSTSASAQVTPPGLPGSFGPPNAPANPAPRPIPSTATPLEPLPGMANTDRSLGMLAIPAPSPTILPPEQQPIDLTTALNLAGVQNPEFNVARTRILEAVAERQLAAAYFLPSLNPGTNYYTHSGNLQQSNGNILSVNRSALYDGAGSNAVGSGTATIPGVYYAGNIGVGIYNYLASKQVVRQQEFQAIAVRNQVFLQVTYAYSELLRAEATRAAQLQAREEAKLIATLTADFAKTGQGRQADANRAATQLARREAEIQAAEGQVLTSSARLCQLLNLDPSIRLHPTDAYLVPQPVVPDPIPVKELITIGLLNRPELASQQAAIRAALDRLDAAKILPFSPTTLIGFSAGAFGGGSNLVRPIFGGFGGRDDLDAIAYWTIQNLGLGNIALIRQADAQLKIQQFEQIEVLNRVRADVAEAYARAHASYARIQTYEQAVRAGYLAYHEDLDRIRFMAANRPRDVLPIELLNSFLLLADDRVNYVNAIVEYNRAQFALYVALGQPPANVLAHPVPVNGVIPKDVPRTPADAPAKPGTAAAAAAAPEISRVASTARARTVRPLIPPPVDFINRTSTAAQ